jgi:hypothetical protein
MSPRKDSGEASGKATRGDNGPEATTTDVPPDANVDKIREILFGGQMHDYELRFTALENRLAAAAAELREDTRARLDALEAYAKKELATLGERVGALDERSAADDRELRDQLLQQSKSLGDDLRRAQRTLSERIDEEARVLRSTKTDRQSLATLLADVAMRLSEPDAAENPGS